MSDDELPELSALILRPTTRTARTLNVPAMVTAPAPRRSPRKQKVVYSATTERLLENIPSLIASSQQRSSPRKLALPRRAPHKTAQTRTEKTVLEDVPELAPATQKAAQRINLKEREIVSLVEEDSQDDLADLLQPLSKLSMQVGSFDSASEKENVGEGPRGKKSQPTSTMSKITQAARAQTSITKQRRPPPKKSNPYVVKEAHCQDINESSGTDGEDEETDLSGFIVDDAAEISFHCPDEEAESSDGEQERRIRRQRKQKPESSPRRRLVRGRRKQVLDDEEEADEDGLSKALDGMNLGQPALDNQKNAHRRKNVEVIDLTSSPIPRPQTPEQDDGAEELSACEEEDTKQTLANPFSGLNNALKLLPSGKSQPQLLPSKRGPLMASPKRQSKPAKRKEPARPSTPTATPPRSPTKLKSPTKLLSPSKRAAQAPRSPHRQSMDAFWDHEVINEWHDTYSPRKDFMISPKKSNPLARFNLFADDGDLSDLSDSQPTTNSNNCQSALDDSSDSLPSPCESPTKTRSPSKLSALQTEQARLKEEKKAKLLAKRKFDAEKECMANTLLLALDTHITSSKISTMSASTGGIKVIWSKTLRSTAGRANWRRTVTKPSGSPVKGNADANTIVQQPGVVVQHFASIELAEKIIDRPERLVNTLAHEFCHLANFMISDIRDQPHGESFKRWGGKVTSWLKSSAATKHSNYRPEWKAAEVTTKHSYVVETKYLWLCAGRPVEKQKQSLAQKMLNIELEDEEGCGAEYGRHSRSIDVEKQRCGRCKGFLVQVRPAPRAGGGSPRKGSPRKRGLRQAEGGGSGSGSGSANDVGALEKLLEVVELSD